MSTSLQLPENATLSTGTKSFIESVLGPFQVLGQFLKVTERYVQGEINLKKARELMGLPARGSAPSITYCQDFLSLGPVFRLVDDKGSHIPNFSAEVEEVSLVTMVNLLFKWGWIDLRHHGILMGALVDRAQKLGWRGVSMGTLDEFLKATTKAEMQT